MSIVKDQAYQFLSDLIFKGFLFLRMDFLGHKFIFKTVNDKEFDLMKLMSGGIEGDWDYTFKLNLSFLVFSLFMIDGENVLKIRDEKYNDFVSLFSEFPPSLHKKILNELTNLKNSTSELENYVEGFCYTDFSRRLWRTSSKNLPNHESLTAISGTEKLGLNFFQESWVLINRMLDDEEDYEGYFSLAIMVASASNGKGSRLTQARHAADIQSTKEKRKKLAWEGTRPKTFKWSDQGWAVRDDSAEGLVAELERQMKGLKDKHDRFIDDYIKNLSDETKKREFEAKQKLEEAKKKNMGMAPISGSQRVLTPEETKKLLEKKPNNLMIVHSDEDISVEESDRYLNKIGSKVLTAKE